MLQRGAGTGQLIAARQFGTVIGLAVLWRRAVDPDAALPDASRTCSTSPSRPASTPIVAVGMTFVDPVRRHRPLGRLDRRARRASCWARALQARPADSRRAAAGARRRGLACGLANGALISWGGLPPFIVTLGTMSIARGARAALHRRAAGLRVRRVVPRARDRPRRLHPGPGHRDGAGLPGRALRADADDVRALRLRDWRERGSHAPVGRGDPLSQDDDLRRSRG